MKILAAIKNVRFFRVYKPNTRHYEKQVVTRRKKFLVYDPSKVVPCDLTTGEISSPPATSVSLLASERRTPLRAAAIAAGNPALPTIATASRWGIAPTERVRATPRWPSARGP